MTQKGNILGEGCVINNQQISKAVKAIYQYVDKTKAERKQLTEHGQNILVQVTLHKVLSKSKDSSVKIPLPHSLVNETAEICMFVKDLDKKSKDPEPSKIHFQDLLSSSNVKQDIEVIPLKAVKLEYIPYEAKRNLSNRYDVFLADNRIARLLPSYLGKYFYSRKRFPIPVDLTSKKLSSEINKALSTVVCGISGSGTSFAVTVSKSVLPEEQTVDNVTASLKKICESVPGGEINIKAVYLKSSVSPALPVFISEVSPNDVQLPKVKSKTAEDEYEDVTTVMGAKVRVSKAGVLQMKYENAETRQQLQEETREPKESKLGKRKRSKNPEKTVVPEKVGKIAEKETEGDNSVSVDVDIKKNAPVKENKTKSKSKKEKLNKKDTKVVKTEKEKVEIITLENEKADIVKHKSKKQGQKQEKDTDKKSNRMEAKGKKQSVKAPKSKKMSKVK